MSPSDPHQPVVLSGGVANRGSVVRIGDRVRRPAGSHTPAVHAYLRHLALVGFAGSPRPLAVSGDREELTFVEGETALPPYPAWVADDGLLWSVAVLQRDLHVASEGFVPEPHLTWGVPYLPAGAGGELVCHNDLCVENVVVRQGRAVGFVDFDYAAPVDPLFDVAVAVRHWVPLRAPADLDPARSGVDQLGRFRLYCQAFDLDRRARRRVVELAGSFIDAALEQVRRRAEAGQPGFAAMWAEGYEAQNRRGRHWLESVGSRLSG